MNTNGIVTFCVFIIFNLRTCESENTKYVLILREYSCPSTGNYSLQPVMLKKLPYGNLNELIDQVATFGCPNAETTCIKRNNEPSTTNIPPTTTILPPQSNGNSNISKDNNDTNVKNINITSTVKPIIDSENHTTNPVISTEKPSDNAKNNSDTNVAFTDNAHKCANISMKNTEKCPIVANTRDLHPTSPTDADTTDTNLTNSTETPINEIEVTTTTDETEYESTASQDYVNKSTTEIALSNATEHEEIDTSVEVNVNDTYYNNTHGYLKSNNNANFTDLPNGESKYIPVGKMIAVSAGIIGAGAGLTMLVAKKFKNANCCSPSAGAAARNGEPNEEDTAM